MYNSAVEVGWGGEMPPYLAYSCQNALVTSSISADDWERLNAEARHHIMTLSHTMEEVFMKANFPPTVRTTPWTLGEKQFFFADFQQWRSNGVDPCRHWGLFSLDFPTKTGGQCSRLYNMMIAKTAAREQHRDHFEENPVAVECIRTTKFRAIVCSIFKFGPESVNEVAQATSDGEEPCNPVITDYPGTGFIVGARLCYASAVLQLLVRIDELVDLVSLQLLRRSTPLLRMFFDLRDQVATCGPPVNIDCLLEHIGLSLDEQQDVHELFVLMIQRMAQDFQDEYLETFEEMFISQFYRETSDGFVADPVTTIDVHVSLGDDCVNLISLLHDVLEQYSGVRTSRVLFIHVVRAMDDPGTHVFEPRKAMCMIEYPDRIGDGVFGEGEYSICGVIYHEGLTIGSGHYFTLLYEGSKVVSIDGSKCSFVRADDQSMRERLEHAQACFFVYVRDIHVQCSFRVAQLLDRPNEQRTTGSSAAICEHPSLETDVHFETRQRISSRQDRQRVYEKFYEVLAASVKEMQNDHSFRPLALNEKLYAAICLAMGMAPAQIAHNMGRSPSTISRFFSSPLGTEREMRAQIVTNHELSMIILNETMSNNRLSCARLADKIYKEHGIPLSKETVRKIRRKVGLRFLAPIPKAKLSDECKDRRVAFAVDFITNNINLLRRCPIIFSDESKFVLLDNGRKLWRIPGECAEADYIEKEQHSCQVMVWGAIGVGYRSKLLCFETNCDQQSYRSILEDNQIIRKLNEHFGVHQFVFQQDNAPPHVAKKTLEWLKSEVHLLDNWPPHSPDLSPVEMMWALCKAKVDITGVKDKRGLFAAVEKVWYEIPDEAIDNMASSFEARLRAVISLCGDSLNGHWVYVHKIHMLMKSVPVEKLDDEIQKLDIRTHKRESSVEVVLEQPLVELAHLEDEFSNELEISEEEEEDLSDGLPWEDCFSNEPLVEPSCAEVDRGLLSRFANMMRATGRFLRQLFRKTVPE